MKPTSIIFLILSIILIACGVGLCFVAENMSVAQDIQLYSQTTDEDGNNIDRYDLDNADISRISLTLDKSDVNIVYNADETYIELVNFSKNTYEFSLSLKTVSLNDTISILSLLNFAEGGFKFEGLRYFFTPDMYKDKQKVVNIYVKRENSLKVIDIEIGDGNLVIDNVISRIDYTINVNKGDVYLDRARSSSIFELNIGEGNVKLIETTLVNCVVNITKGDFEQYVTNYSNQTFDLTTSLGKVYFGSSDKGGTYSQEIPVAATKSIVNIGTGDIIINENNKNNEDTEK